MQHDTSTLLPFDQYGTSLVRVVLVVTYSIIRNLIAVADHQV